MPGRPSGKGPSLVRLRALIAELTLSGAISLERVAERLHTSLRSPHRRLRARGVQFGAIVIETRPGIAAALVRDTELSVREIAACIGHGTPGAFARPFGRWARLPPRAYRTASGPKARDWRETVGNEDRCAPESATLDERTGDA